MLNWIIDFSLRHRFLVIAVALALAAVGAVSLGRLDIDAFPDTTPVQIQINTVAPSLSPEEVERQITFPVEQAISGLPGLDNGAFHLEVRPVPGGRHVPGRDRHLLRPAACQRAARHGGASRGNRSVRRWGRSRRGWAKSSIMS